MLIHKSYPQDIPQASGNSVPNWHVKENRPAVFPLLVKFVWINLSSRRITAGKTQVIGGSVKSTSCVQLLENTSTCRKSCRHNRLIHANRPLPVWSCSDFSTQIPQVIHSPTVELWEVPTPKTGITNNKLPARMAPHRPPERGVL